MILLVTLIAGLAIGVGSTWWKHRPYHTPDLRQIWLVFAAFLPQLLVAYLPPTRQLLPERIAALLLMASLLLFVTFAWLNRSLPGIPLMLAGLVSNLIVMAANGGWMPISPRTLGQLNTNALQALDLGSRIGQKDVLLLPQNTHLAFLSDHLLLPAWLPYQAAFSPGDILIGLGIFLLLARPINQIQKPERVTP